MQWIHDHARNSHCRIELGSGSRGQTGHFSINAAPGSCRTPRLLLAPHMALLPECDIFFARESWQANVEIGITKSRAAVSEGYQARKYPLPMGSREEKLKKAKSLDALPRFRLRPRENARWSAFVPPDHHANDSVTAIAQVGPATTQSLRERCAARGNPRA